MFFPLNGIVKQATESIGVNINATAGVAYDDDGRLMTLPSLQKYFGLETNRLNYAPTPGIEDLRYEWMREIHEKNPSLGTAPTTLPIVTNGLTHGINITGQLFLAPGDEVILADKFWDNYNIMLEMGLKAKLKAFPTFDGEGYNIKDVERMAMEGPVGKKFFVFNVPNNPTGYSLTKKEQERIVEILVRSAEMGNDIVVLCDDAYFGLYYENDIAPESIFARLANAHDNILAVKIDGATKEKFAWGLRIGFITIGGKSLTPDDIEILENKICGIIRTNASNCSRVAQEAVLGAMSDPHHADEISQATNILKERYLVSKQILNENKEKFSKCFNPLPSNSGYFLALELNKGIDGEIVRQTLLRDHNIGIIAVDNWLRVAFSAVNKSKIPHLFQTIYKVCEEQL